MYTYFTARMNSMHIIGPLYRHLLKPIFFKFDPEQVHDFMTSSGKFLGSNALLQFITRKTFAYEHPSLVQTVDGITYTNPVGLSAGFDKNAKLLNILPAVGFGFEEVGSITRYAYEGNPKPRLYRLPKSKGLVVYYGLMNDGVEKIVPRIKKATSEHMRIGISIAKTNCKDTATIDGGIADYVACLQYVEHEKVGDYYTINVSCPNTFGGEPFTTPDRLELLLKEINTLNISKPIFVKLPVDLSLKEFDALLKICVEYKMTGVVIANLTKDRTASTIKDIIPEHIKGGISGKPTFDLSNELISYAYKKYGKELIIIGVGGIFSAEDAYEKIKRGASLVQLITGMIFQGPQLIGEINRGLVKLIQKDGYKNISEAIGSHHSQDLY